jgi:hypothetical protein
VWSERGGRTRATLAGLDDLPDGVISRAGHVGLDALGRQNCLRRVRSEPEVRDRQALEGQRRSWRRRRVA